MILSAEKTRPHLFGDAVFIRFYYCFFKTVCYNCTDIRSETVVTHVHIKEKHIQHTLMGLTFALVLITGIAFRQPALRMLPLGISIVVLTMQGNADRYGYLLGGLNCVLYGLVYLQIGLYATAASSLLLSCPLQIITFFNWKRHAYKKSVIFKKLSVKGLILAISLFLAAWLGIFAALCAAGSQYALLDNTSSLLAVAVTVLSMLTYIEYSYLWPISIAVNILLNLQVTMQDPRQITYLIYSLYSFYCVVQGFIHVRRLYREQQLER